MDMMAYHRSDDITIDLMAATIDMMTGLPISINYSESGRKGTMLTYRFFHSYAINIQK